MRVVGHFDGIARGCVSEMFHKVYMPKIAARVSKLTSNSDSHSSLTTLKFKGAEVRCSGHNKRI